MNRFARTCLPSCVIFACLASCASPVRISKYENIPVDTPPPEMAKVVPILYETEFCKVLPLGEWRKDWDVMAPELQALALRMDGPDRFWIMPTEHSTWWVNPDTGVATTFIGQLRYPRPSWLVDLKSQAVRVCTAMDFLQSDWTPRPYYQSDQPAINETPRYRVLPRAGGLEIVDVKSSKSWPDDTRKAVIKNVWSSTSFATQNIVCVVEGTDDRHSFNLRFVDCETATVIDESVSVSWNLANGMSYSNNWTFAVKPEGLAIVYLRTAVLIVDIQKLRSMIDARKK